MIAQAHLVGHPIGELDTPALLVDLDKLEQNIATMRRIIIQEAGIGWRPHTKAIKTPAIAYKLLRAGAHGVTCAKLGEAEVMAAAGIQDILIANQVVGAPKVARLVYLCRHADVIVAVDSEAHVKILDAAAQAAGIRLRVVVEVNMGINRAGVEPGNSVVALAKHVASCRGLRFAGLMGWEGQTASMPDPEAKRRAIETVVARMTESAERCRATGLPVEIVSCGGTGTYWITARLPGVTEVQAGGGIFCDVHYRKDFGVQHEYALSILTTVISRPTPTRIICDAGWKTMAQQPAMPEPRDLGEVKSLRLSAEHATIELVSPQSTPHIGDRVEFVAGYSDSTVFLHDYLYGARAGRLEVIWPILGRGMTQ
ncbi:MAG: DSD1 family PLP-dependent enzyme [Candidatus Methylomirabilota bacterium]|jgi:D-serine deaminase-like pyridoxal phosphate-dependent protein